MTQPTDPRDPAEAAPPSPTYEPIPYEPAPYAPAPDMSNPYAPADFEPSAAHSTPEPPAEPTPVEPAPPPVAPAPVPPTPAPPTPIAPTPVEPAPAEPTPSTGHDWPPASDPYSGSYDVPVYPTASVPVPYSGPAGYPAPVYAYVDPNAPYGYDRVTGQPLSSKSKTTAGLLQLLLGFMFSLGGVGRLYAGNTTLGVIQIAATLVAWTSCWCGFALFFVPWVLWFGIWVWFVVDGIVLLSRGGVDGVGRPLR